MEKKNVLKFIVIDYITCLNFLMSIIFFIGACYLAYKDYDLLPILIFGAVVILGLIFTIIRISIINSILKSDIEVEGVITKVWFYRDRGNIQYKYSYEGVDYKYNHRVMKIRTTKIYRIGNEVILKVSNNNPKQALIKGLFFEY